MFSSKTSNKKLCAELKIPVKAEYVRVVRLALSSIAADYSFSEESIEDMKVAVSEACTNAVQYAYAPEQKAKAHVEISFWAGKDNLEIIVKDEGKGFNAQQPPQRHIHDKDIHLGLGIVFMKNLMDQVEIKSQKNKGTTVRLVKKFSK